MFEFSVAILIALGLSILGNIGQYLASKKPSQKQDHEQLKILADLLNNHRVLVRMERVDPSEYFIRSPKQ